MVSNTNGVNQHKNVNVVGAQNAHQPKTAETLVRSMASVLRRSAGTQRRQKPLTPSDRLPIPPKPNACLGKQKYQRKSWRNWPLPRKMRWSRLQKKERAASCSAKLASVCLPYSPVDRCGLKTGGSTFLISSMLYIIDTIFFFGPLLHSDTIAKEFQ